MKVMSDIGTENEDNAQKTGTRTRKRICGIIRGGKGGI
jgi:hypothetical protein